MHIYVHGHRIFHHVYRRHSTVWGIWTDSVAVESRVFGEQHVSTLMPWCLKYKDLMGPTWTVLWIISTLLDKLCSQLPALFSPSFLNCALLLFSKCEHSFSHTTFIDLFPHYIQLWNLNHLLNIPSKVSMVTCYCTSCVHDGRYSIIITLDDHLLWFLGILRPTRTAQMYLQRIMPCNSSS